MDAVLRAALVQYLDRELPVAANEFSSRRLSRDDAKSFRIRPFAYYAFRRGTVEQFVSFRPAKAGNSGQFIVECGWFSTPPVPIVSVDSVEAFQRLVDGRGEVPTSLAIRLFNLCEGRGRVERYWDMYSPEVWDASRESYSEFNDRLAWAAVDKQIEVSVSGGPTAEYAAAQAAMVGRDCVQCFSRFGSPFLARYARNNAV